MKETPPGMKIVFDEENMTKWEILLDGPEQSVYAVRFPSAYSTYLPNVYREYQDRSYFLQYLLCPYMQWFAYRIW